MSQKTILVTNDDGIIAPGILSLLRVLVEAGYIVYSVAPAVDQSGKSASLTIHGSIMTNKHIFGEESLSFIEAFSIEGTPVDCVLLALDSQLFGKKSSL